MVPTYDGQFPDGSKSYGGYAKYWRGPAAFAFHIPDNLPSAHAAPMLCGATTVFSPLKRAIPDPATRARKTAGIVGIGGLGHFGILFAKALGYKRVVAISRSSTKKSDALKLGADAFIATAEDKDWQSSGEHVASIDVIVCTVSSPDMPIAGYLQLLRQFGQFIQVGIPEGPLPEFPLTALCPGNKIVSGSLIGPPREIEEMLKLAAEKGVKPWVEERSMKDGANQAVVDMAANKARYRYVLVNDS